MYTNLYLGLTWYKPEALGETPITRIIRFLCLRLSSKSTLNRHKMTIVNHWPPDLKISAWETEYREEEEVG